MPKFIWLPLALGGLLLAADEAGEQLLAAARKGDTAAVKELLDKGADVNTKNRYGSTPLFFACDRGHLEVAKLLIDRGADLNVQDTFYNATALTWAMSKKHDALVELLIDRGVDVSSALQHSIQTGDQKLFDLVTRRGTLHKRMLDEGLLLATLGKKEAMIQSLESLGATRIQLEVPEATGKAIAGKYIDGENSIPVAYTDGKLTVGPNILVPAGKDQYRLLQAGVTVTFERNAEGAVTGARISGRGGDAVYKKGN